jgi:hypothetical protein
MRNDNFVFKAVYLTQKRGKSTTVIGNAANTIMANVKDLLQLGNYA